MEARLMKVGLMADTHDRVPAIAEFIRLMAEAGVGMVLHAGDYCSPFSLAPFHERHMALAGVFGRNDGDPEGLKAFAQKGMGTELYESPHSFELGGHRILLVHDIGDASKRSIGQHTFVIHGATHQQEMKTRGEATIINPGEACGWMYGAPTAAILDLDTKQLEYIRLTDPKWKF
jgi:putative phosphoesterase